MVGGAGAAAAIIVGCYSLIAVLRPVYSNAAANSMWCERTVKTAPAVTDEGA